MKKFILTTLLLISNYIIQAQKILITDSETNEPLEMATLSCINSKTIATTNSNGEATISELIDCKNIEIRSMGYKTMAYTFQQLKDSNFKISLEPNFLKLKELVFSANKWNQKNVDLTQRISTISAKKMQLQNPQTAADLLATSGEVFIQKSQQGGGSPMIRGFATNRLLYSIDGVRMNTAIFRAGNIQNVISIDPFSVEKTEVLFGPSSVIYGSDAIGGVMSFNTLKPKLSTTENNFIKGSALMRYSSANNENTGHFDINLGHKKWASLSSISFNKFGDLKMGSNGPDEYLRPNYVVRIDSIDHVVTNTNPQIQNPTGYSQMNLMQKFKFKIDDEWEIQYGLHYSETSEYARYDRLIETANNGLPRSAVWNYGPQKWMMNLLTISQNKNLKLYDHFVIRAAHQYFEESRIDRNFSGGNRFRLRTQKEKVDAFSFNADFSKLYNKHQFFYGMEFVKNNVESTGSGKNISTGDTIPTSSRYPNSVWNSIAAYSNYQYKLNSKILLNSGIRFNHYAVNSDFSNNLNFYPFNFSITNIKNNAITGSLGFAYNPTENASYFGNFSSGFRAPNVDDMGKLFDFAAGEIVVPNSNLKAEKAYNAEVGFTKIINNSLKIDATFFYTILQNAMVRRAFTVDGKDSILFDGNLSKVFAIQNAAKANVYGFNAGIEIKLAKGFIIASKFNYQIGTEEMNNGDVSRSRHAVPWFGMSRLNYSKDKLNVELYANYCSEINNKNLNEEEKQKPFIYAKDINGNPYSPSWWTLNFKTMYQISTNIFFSGGVENIADIRYRPYSSGIVAPGRNFILSFKTVF